MTALGEDRGISNTEANTYNDENKAMERAVENNLNVQERGVIASVKHTGIGDEPHTGCTPFTQ